MNKNFYKRGVTLVEVIISVVIISLITVTLTTFMRDVFSLNYALQGGLNAQIDASHVVKVMVTEIREAGPSALGAYPIAIASSTTITFYSDVDNNGVKDKIRYFVSGKTLNRGVIAPIGNPLVYNNANEKLTTLISGLVSSSTLPVFQYYPSSYAGTTTPLAFPVDIPSIRLVKVTVIIDSDPNKSPTSIIISSQVNIRNLKDNL